MTFRFQAVIEFEITPQEAASLLAENDGRQTVPEWLHQHCPVLELDSHYNANAMKQALGKHLAEQSVESARQLTHQA